MLPININDAVKVKLTKHGEKLYKEFYKAHPILIKIDKDNIVETELWSLMEIFGKHLYNGCIIPFERNEILIEFITCST